MSQVVQVELLEGFRVRCGDENVQALDAGRLKSLFSYLILHRDQPLQRSRLAGLFWPESSEQQSRTNLRQLLHHLRRALPEPRDLVTLEHDRVQLNAEYQIDADVSRFTDWVARAGQAESARDYEAMIDALERAAEIYRGELLPGCYDEWVIDERARLEQLHLDALRRLVALLESAAEPDAAIAHARSVLARDPMDEATSRCLMRLLAARGDRAGLHRVYHRLAAELERELGVSPADETRSLFASLVQNPREQGESIVFASSDGATLAGTAPLLERRGEWLKLLACWRSIRQWPSRAALINAEMGAGKTRLALDFADHVRRRNGRVAVARCFSAARDLSFAPVREWLRAESVERHFATLDNVWLSELSRLLPELVQTFSGVVQPGPMSDTWQRQNFLEAMARAILAGGAPLLLVLDDVQECDDDTLEWLEFLFRFDRQAPVLVLATLRVEELRAGSRLEQLLLDFGREERLMEIEPRSLSREGVGRIAEHMLGDALAADVLERLYSQTGGNPLFVVESIRFGRLDQELFDGSAVAPRIESVVQARYAQLPQTTRALVALAATVGGGFTVDFLTRAGALSEEQVLVDLNLLWHKRIVVERDGNEYDFAHPILREVASNSIGAPERQRLHRAIALALAAMHGRDAGTAGGRLAAHYEGAGMFSDAIRALQSAARAALDVYANEQAIRYLSSALKLLESVPQGRNRDRLELDLLIALGAPLVVINGYGFKEACEIYRRAAELGRALGKRAEIAPALRGLSIAYVELGRLEEAIEMGREILDLAAEVDDPMLRVEGYYSIGVALFWQGRFDESRRALERAIERCEDVSHAAHIPSYGQSPLVICLVRLAFTLWHLGRADEALSKQAEALEQAETLGHPYSLAYALSFSAWLHYFRRDVDATEQLTERLLRLCVEHSFRNWRVLAEILAGWCQSRRGRIDSGLALVRHVLDDAASPLNLMNQPFGLCVLAEIHRAARDTSRARRAIDQALSIVESGETCWLHAELLRQRALVELIEPGPGNKVTVAYLRKALRVAQAQGALLVALRAACDLAGLERCIGQPGAALELLEEVLAAVPEGTRTCDLERADALRSELVAEIEERS